jgi:hypothetical protein
METLPDSDAQPSISQTAVKASVNQTIVACVAGVLVPGLGHALLRKWDRAVVFFASISLMLVIGIRLNGRLFGPDFTDIFSTLKFLADAGLGLFYWLPWFWTRILGDPKAYTYFLGDPKTYTYDYANVFIYVAGLLNMLVIVDTFDIAMGRKK